MRKHVLALLVVGSFLLNFGSIDENNSSLTCDDIVVFKGVTSICDTDLHPYFTMAGNEPYIWTANNGLNVTTYTNTIYLDFTSLCGATYLEVKGSCSGGGYTNTLTKSITLCPQICN